MFKTKRQRAVVLALIAFFCVGASTFVSVDWKRLGGGFLAFLHGKGDRAVAAGGTPSDSEALRRGHGDAPPPPAPQQVAIATTRRHASGTPRDTGGGKSDEDLFKYGDPAAGSGIPPGSFIVAQNDNGAGGSRGDGPATAPPASPGVTGPAPAPGGEIFGAPAGSNPNGNDPALRVGTSAAPTPPVSPTPPASPTPSAPSVSPTPSPAAPAPSPTQSGTTDPGTGGGGTTVPTTPSAIPEPSQLAMMSLGALFVAAAAARRRQRA
jgi:hypothetical protein